MTQPVTLERTRQELDILMNLGPALIAARGFGAQVVEHTYTRARELARQTGQFEQLFQATWGQWVHYNQIGDSITAKKLKEHLFDQAKQSRDESLLLEAHHSGWTTEWTLGNLSAVVEHTRNGIAIYKPEMSQDHIRIYGHDPMGCALMMNARALWMLGHPDQAEQRAIEAFVFGMQLDHPFSSAFARWGIVDVKLLRGEIKEAAEKASELDSFVKEQGFPLFIAMANTVQGALLVTQGKIAEGIAKIRDAQSMAERIGALIIMPWILCELLEACLETGEIEEGLNAVKRELESYSITGERWLESEIRRFYGELILADDPDRTEEAEAEFQLAIDISQRQYAKSLELRAVMSLARLWQKQGKTKQAHDCLSKVYNWFTEGLDTYDLKTAKTLLE